MIWSIIVQIGLQLIQMFVKNDKHREALLKQMNDFIAARDKRYLDKLEQNKRWQSVVDEALAEARGEVKRDEKNS